MLEGLNFNKHVSLTFRVKTFHTRVDTELFPIWISSINPLKIETCDVAYLCSKRLYLTPGMYTLNQLSY